MPERQILIQENGYKITSCSINGLLVVERAPQVDERGFFKEVFRKELLQN
ncbi:MAG: hypothetical protein AAB778_00780 [Patescibacteria group bacterium]